MQPIAVIYWTDPDGAEWNLPFEKDADVEWFIRKLKEENLFFYTCLCGGKIPSEGSGMRFEKVI